MFKFVCLFKVRKLAFEVAKTYNIKIPDKWNEESMASASWFTNFMKRHHKLSIRRPQATSLYRQSSFNETNVNKFFTKLTSVYSKYQFQPQDVWNMDETGLMTVQKPGHLVATRGERRVGSITSAERGTLVTMALACNAMGNIIPPHFIFPRKRFLPHFVLGGPEGCLGTANGSGWMQEEDFLTYLRHFVHHTRASAEKKVLLLLDNHSSHISTAAINYCRENGVVMLSFPPHCTHHLQPLDKAVYGPLKRLLASEMDQWHRHHPGKTVTIYDMPSLLNTILLEAASPRNILKGFSSTGIWPLNKDIFPADVFLPASVTDRPPPVIPGPSHDDPSLSLPGPSNTDPSVMCSADLSLSIAGPSNADPSLSPAGPSNADPSLSLAGPSNADPSLSLAGPSNADPPVMRRADPSLSLAKPSADLSLSLSPAHPTRISLSPSLGLLPMCHHSFLTAPSPLCSQNSQTWSW